MTTTSDMVRIRGQLPAGQDPPRPQRHVELLTRDQLRRAKHRDVVRLARWMAGDPARVPTCECGDCRAALIGAVWRATR